MLAWYQINSILLNFQTAERSIGDLKQLKVFFMGNAPSGVFKQNEENIKTYFFKAQVISFEKSESKISKEVDYIWVKKSELKNFVQSPEYFQAIDKFLLDF
jgi:hypothetical protein